MPDPFTDSQPLNAALSAARTAVDHLIETAAAQGPDALEALPDDQLLQFSVAVERLRNRLTVLDRPIVAALETNRVAEKQLVRSTARLLADRLLITAGEARRRVEVVEACGPRRTMTGEVLPPRRPVLADAQDCGAVSPEQTATILRGLAGIEKLVGLRPHPEAPDGDADSVVGPDDLDRAEADLVAQARLFCGADLATVGSRILDVLNPDGDPDRTEAQERLRGLHLHRLACGLTRIHGDLLPETAQAVKAVLTSLARPAAAVDAGDGSRSLDDRTREQRWHDALDDACRRLLDAGGLPVAGGVPATILVTIDEEALRTRTGSGTCPDGTRLPIQTVLRIADQAQIIPTVLTATGRVLVQGRARRIATTNQTLALYARDDGCTFPGCNHPPDWCERHHIRAWEDGGRTDLENLTLLCPYHHRRFQQHGWTCTMVDGLPHWTAPPHLDPGQTRQLHARLQTRLDERARRRARLPVAEPIIPIPTGSKVEALLWNTTTGRRVEVVLDGPRPDLHRAAAC